MRGSWAADACFVHPHRHRHRHPPPQDGNTDFEALRKAIDAAKAVTDKPTFIKVTTLIGYGSPNKSDTHDVHGAPLGPEETAATRANLKWEYPEFEVPKVRSSHRSWWGRAGGAAFAGVLTQRPAHLSTPGPQCHAASPNLPPACIAHPPPQDVYDAMRSNVTRGATAQGEWNKTVEAYKAKYPKEAAEFTQLISGKLPTGWEKALPTYTPEDKPLATRQYSQIMLNALAPVLPGLMGGSADLAPSNLTLMKMFGDFQKGSYQERNVRFGVREHGMGAIVNGMGLHGSGIIPYCATFFIFTDYMRGAMRMSALSEVRQRRALGRGGHMPLRAACQWRCNLRLQPQFLGPNPEHTPTPPQPQHPHAPPCPPSPSRRWAPST